MSNCKPFKDDSCNSCPDNMLCQNYLGLKNLDDYDDTDKVDSLGKMEWDNETPIIVTARKNPLLGIEIDTNVAETSIPDYIMNRISTWAKEKAEPKMRHIVDNVGITATFMP